MDLKQQLKQASLTQKNFSDRIGLTESWISQMVNGTKPVPVYVTEYLRLYIAVKDALGYNAPHGNTKDKV